MTPTSPPPIVRIERLIAAPPDRVFAAWLDPALLARWMSPVGHAEADIEPRVGGRLRVSMIGGDVRIEHHGEYREVVPDRRLVFTWQSPYTGLEPSVVIVEFEPTEAGTRLTLVHERLPAEAVESHRSGWGPMLDRLVALVLEAGSQGGR